MDTTDIIDKIEEKIMLALDGIYKDSAPSQDKDAAEAVYKLVEARVALLMELEDYEE